MMKEELRKTAHKVVYEPLSFTYVNPILIIIPNTLRTKLTDHYPCPRLAIGYHTLQQI